MKNRTYSRLLMAPLLALLAVACSPNQFNQTNEYDDVYFTSSDRSTQVVSKTKTQQALLDQQQKQVTVNNYSTENVDAQLLNKYNNGQPQQVTYFEDGPIVKSAQELNFDDFVADFENEQLAYYELPLNWNQDWDRFSFNQKIQDDFYFRLAWYDQYYLNNDFRMTQYLSQRNNRFQSRGINSFGRSQIGLSFGINNFNRGFNNIAFIDINPWGGYYNSFWRPRRGFGFGFGWNNNFYDPFFCPPFYNNFNGWGWRNGWRNNVFVNNNIFLDRRADRILARNNSRSRNVSRGPRVGTSRVATVRNEAVNGSAPATRSSRYVDNLANGSRSSRSTTAGTSRSGRASLNNGSTSRSSNSTVSSNSSSRSSRARTDAYRFNNNGSSRSSRSSAVRNNGSGTSRSSSGTSRASSSRSSRSSSAGTSSSRSRSTPSFGRSSSSSRSSSARSSSSRGSSSRSSSARGSSSSRSSYSRGSSSRSSGSASRGSSRSSSSRSSGASRSSSSSSRSSSGSSRSSSSRSGSSSSRSGSSRGSRGN